MRTTRLLFARPPANFPKWTEGSGRCWLEQWLELTQETRIRSSKDRLHGFCDLGRGFVFVFTSECMTFRASGDLTGSRVERGCHTVEGLAACRPSVGPDPKGSGGGRCAAPAFGPWLGSVGRRPWRRELRGRRHCRCGPAHARAIVSAQGKIMSSHGR